MREGRWERCVVDIGRRQRGERRCGVGCDGGREGYRAVG